MRSAAKVTSLELLYLYSLNITDLSPIRSLKKLNTLNVNNDSKITQHDLSDLSGLTRLRKLQINGTGVTSLRFLMDDFPHLRELEARNLKKLKNANASFCSLANHPHLNKVILSKSIKKSMDTYVQNKYGANAEDWFNTHGVTVSFK